MILASGLTVGLAFSSAVALCGYALAAVPPVGTSTTSATNSSVARDTRSNQGVWMRWALLAGWVGHGLALFLDVTQSASLGGARFGFAPALSAMVWLVVAVYAVESRMLPLGGVRRWLAVLGLAAVTLALLFPGEAKPHLASPWTPVHWLLGVASYGLFGAAVLHAVLLSAAERRLRHGSVGGAQEVRPLGMPLLTLEKLTFRFVQAGFVILTATLALGWLTAGPWQWNHKAVLSLMAWLVFAGLLAGRQAFGWRGRLAVRWLYAGALLLLLAYAGSRFVLEVLLPRGTP